MLPGFAGHSVTFLWVEQRLKGFGGELERIRHLQQIAE